MRYVIALHFQYEDCLLHQCQTASIIESLSESVLPNMPRDVCVQVYTKKILAKVGMLGGAPHPPRPPQEASPQRLRRQVQAVAD